MTSSAARSLTTDILLLVLRRIRVRVLWHHTRNFWGRRDVAAVAAAVVVIVISNG